MSMRKVDGFLLIKSKIMEIDLVRKMNTLAMLTKPGMTQRGFYWVKFGIIEIPKHQSVPI